MNPTDSERLDRVFEARLLALQYAQAEAKKRLDAALRYVQDPEPDPDE